jgi:capsular polysaccharide biosynthesis protein
MKKIINWKTTVTISVLFFTAAGLFYSFTTTKIYTSKSQTALFRLKIEAPDINSEESRNRWIWIRDGLNLKSALVTDKMLENITITNPTAKEQLKKYPDKQLMMEYLRSLINIQFTGADENNFIVEVKAPDPLLAFELNSNVFDRIKYLAIDADRENFNSVMVELKKKQSELKTEPQTNEFYDDKIRKLIFTQTIDQKQRENAFKIISYPTVNKYPVWPAHKLIIIISVFMGLIFGIAVDYIINFYLSEK